MAAFSLANLLSMSRVYRDVAWQKLGELDLLHPGRYFRDVVATAEAQLTGAAVSELQDLITPGFERDEFIPAKNAAP